MSLLLTHQQHLVANQTRRQHSHRHATACTAFTAPLQRSCSRRTQSQPRRRVTTMGLFGLGLPEVAVVAGIAVLVFGPSKLPALGKELGKSVKSFQTAAKEFETELKNATDETADKLEDQTDKVKDELRK